MSANVISVEKVLLILSKRFLLICGVLVFALVIAGIATALAPKMYKTSTSVHFDFKSANPIDDRGRSLEEAAYLSTQIDIIKSQNVAKKVEESLTKYEKERLIRAFQKENTLVDNFFKKAGKFFSVFTLSNEDASPASDKDGGNIESLEISSAYSWLTLQIGSNLEVKQRFKSRIVDIFYVSSDPEIATLMANRFTDAYIATNLQMVIDPARKTSGWFSDQLKSLRKKLEEAQARLTSYQQKEGIVSSDERLDTETARLQELSSQLVTAQKETRYAVTEQNKLKDLQESGASEMTLASVFNNSIVQIIKQEIRNLESKLVEISTSLGKNHPKYISVNSELEAARQRLTNEIKSISDGINSAATLANDRERDLKAALDRQKQLVLDLKQEHNRISVLIRDVESAQATYNAALSEQNKTNMQSLVDQTNVSVVDLANIPVQPSSPRITTNLMLGAFIGVLLGIGLAILKEMFHQRIYSKEDLIKELELPLLGHLKKV